MRNIIIVGGSKGIGNAIIKCLVDNNNIINISRTKPSLSHNTLTHYPVDVVKDELPIIDKVDKII